MTKLFDKAAKVIIYRQDGSTFAPGPVPGNAIEITDLRVQFEVTKNLKGEPNTCDLVITNLAPGTRSAIAKKPIRVILQAGYDGVLRHVFAGDLRWSNSQLNGTDWETLIQVADGARACRHARVNRTYARGAPVLSALQEAATSMNLTLPKNVTVSAELQAQFSAGRSLEGRASDELTRLLAPYGYSWSIQDGALQILKDEETRPGTEILISKDTGMVGSPEYAAPAQGGKKPATLTVTIKMDPRIVPGDRVRVQSREVNGIFKVQRVTHSGDTKGDEFETEIEATPST